jgi:prolyl-tRNA editing enzyme YbaK/EbsC (Cys-tRNA(Pro) deacylase)
MNPLNADDLQAFLQVNSIPAEILRLPVPTPTVETAAQAVGAQERQIVKSILFLVDAQPVLAIACGTAYIDRRAIADLYGVGKKRVKLASPEEVMRLSGYEVGAMPPFGHRQPLRSLLDKRILELSEAFAGGGAENALMRISPQEMLRVSKAQVMDLVGGA